MSDTLVCVVLFLYKTSCVYFCVLDAEKMHFSTPTNYAFSLKQYVWTKTLLNQGFGTVTFFPMDFDLMGTFLIGNFKGQVFEQR